MTPFDRRIHETRQIDLVQQIQVAEEQLEHLRAELEHIRGLLAVPDEPVADQPCVVDLG